MAKPGILLGLELNHGIYIRFQLHCSHMGHQQQHLRK